MKKKEKRQNILIIVLICGIVLSIIFIFLFAMINHKSSTKEYISPDELTLQNKKRKEIAIAGEIEAYGNIYIYENHVCPKSLSDFLNNMDVLDELRLVRESNHSCWFTYKNMDGEIIKIVFDTN